MNLQEIRELQSVHAHPCVTITLPTHRTFPDNRQDQIRVKNLVKQATDRLDREFSKREIAPLIARLDDLASHIDYQHTLDGLVLAVNAEMAHEYVLPFALAERVVVDDNFFTRDLVRAYNRTYRYWMLSLSEVATRLFAGTREHLDEVVRGGFPMTHTGPGGLAPLPAGPGANPSRHRDEHHRHFFRAVERAARPILQADPLPLAIAGVDRYQSFFREVAPNADIISTVPGNYDTLTPHQLGQLVWPSVNHGFAARRNEVLDQLAAAVSRHRSASTLGQVWRLARLGQGAVLVVEDGYHQPARINDSGLLDLDVADTEAPDVLDDAVDEVIETVIAKGGRVVFVEDGALSAHGRIAMILRY
jgi:hypothetical protein